MAGALICVHVHTVLLIATGKVNHMAMYSKVEVFHKQDLD